MSDGSTFQIAVDASKGRADLRSFSAEVDRVGNSLSKLANAGGGFAALGNQIAAASSGFDKLKSVAGIGGVAKEIGTLSRSLNGLRSNPAAVAGLTQLSRALSQLSHINLPRGLGQNLESLTRGLAGFRVPEMKDLARLPAMFKQLESLSNTKINPQTGASIQYLANGMRAIGSLRANNLARLPTAFDAINRIRIDPDRSKALVGIADALKSMGDFRAPSAVAVRNLSSFITTLQNADPAKLRSVATSLHGITLPAINARSLAPQPAAPVPSAATFRPSSAASVMSTGSFANASSGLHQLQQSFSAVHAAAAAFVGYLGGLSLRSFVSETLAAGNAITSFKLTLESVATHAGEVGQHFDFVKQLAKDTGGSLATMIPAFQQFDAALQASGMSAQTAQTTFSGFQKAFSVMHVGIADQKRAMKELTEVFGAEAGHARQVQIGLSSHLPTIMSNLAKVMGKTSKEVHEQFKDGGIDPSAFVKLGEYYNKTFDVQLPEALRHSQAQLNAFGNAWFLFQEKVFSSGFDTGLSTMLQRLTAAFDTPKFSGLAEKLGSSFQSAFAALGSAGAVAANHAEGFTRLATAVALATTASIGLQVVGLLVAPLTAAAGAAVRLGAALLTLSTPVAIPLLAGAAALAAVVASSDSAEDAIGKLSRGWDYLKTSAGNFVSGIAPLVSATFSGMAEDGQTLVNVLKEIAVYSGTVREWWNNGLRQPDNWRETAAARRKEMESIISGPSTSPTPVAGGGDFVSKFQATIDKMKAVVGPAMSGMFDSMGGGLLKEWQAEQAKTQAALAKTSVELQHHGDHAANAATAAERLRRETEELKDAQTKLLDKLQPSNAALVELRKNLETIEGMKGRKDALGNVIDQNRIDALTKQAKLNALPSINPAAESIRKLTEEVGIKSRFAGDKDAIADETTVLEARNAALKAGADFTSKQEQALRALLAANRELDSGGSNPFAKWAAGVKSDSEMMTDTVKSSLDDISSKISDLVVNGKGKFKDLGTAIRATFASVLGDIAKKLIKNGIDSLMRDGIKSLSGMFGGADSGIAKALGLGKSVTADALSGMADKTIAAATATVNAGSVIVNGGAGAIGTSGVNAFNPSGAASGSAMGGLSPQNLPAAINPPVGNVSSGLSMFAGQPPILSSNPGASVSSALPSLSMALDKPGEGLASIGRNSISAFGSGIGPAATTSTGVVTMALGRDGQPLGTIGRNGFSGLTPLASSRAVDLGKINGGLSGFSAQSPASLLNARTATDNLARSGIAPEGLQRAFIPGGNSPADVEKYVRSVAAKNGIDPDVAARVIRQESSFKFDSRNINAREESYGPMQLNARGGLGAEALRKGINVRDPSTWHEQVEFGMGVVKKDGWRQWYGARDVGISRWQGIDRNFGKQAANPSIDYSATGSIAGQGKQLADQMKPEFKQVGQELSKNLTQSVKGATPEVTQDLEKAFKGGSSGAEDALGGFASKIQETGSAATSAEGGLSGLISKLGSLGGGMGGGGGLFGGGGDMLAGMFSEGGYSDSPVSGMSMPASYWSGAPQFKEGGISDGGMPAILHSNEAVVNLTRGRKIPVELTGGGERGGGNTTVHNHLALNMQTKDADSFRRSSHQTAVALQNMLGRAAARSA